MDELIRKAINLIFELGQLRRIKHEGWRMVGIENPESVAEHSLRAAQIGYVLAKMENYSRPEEVCSMLVFHDMEECRIGDIHKVASRYLKASESMVVSDQTRELGDIGKAISGLWMQIEEKSTQAGIIAKDADLLEAAFTAREYKEVGIPLMDLWMENYMKYLQTKSGKLLLEKLMHTETVWWWKGLSNY